MELPPDTVKSGNKIDRHCNMLIFKKNALLKKVLAKILKFEQYDFAQPWKITGLKSSKIKSDNWS